MKSPRYQSTDPTPPRRPLSARLMGWVWLILVAALPLYLLADLALGRINEDDRRTARAALCAEADTPEGEAARRAAFPVTILGEIDRVVRCSLWER